MKITRLPLLTALLLLCVGAAAETQYVTDKLRLSVYLTRDASGDAFTYLNSGDKVEILERDGRLTFVELEDGRTGWVRGAFLQVEEPALRRIAAVEATNERLAAELETLKASNSGEAIARLEAAADEAAGRAAAAEDETQRLQAEVRDLQDDLAAFSGAVPLWWLVAAIGGSLLLGVLLGWRWFDYRSRRRHGGFRIY